jgi:hypothetical protein
MHVKMVHRNRPIHFDVSRLCPRRSIAMLDLIMLAIGLGFFALAVGYTHACDRL